MWFNRIRLLSQSEQRISTCAFVGSLGCFWTERKFWYHYFLLISSSVVPGVQEQSWLGVINKDWRSVGEDGWLVAAVYLSNRELLPLVFRGTGLLSGAEPPLLSSLHLHISHASDVGLFLNKDHWKSQSADPDSPTSNSQQEKTTDSYWELDQDQQTNWCSFLISRNPILD